MAKTANEAYSIRLAALRRKAQQLDALVERLDNPPDVNYGYVGDLAHVNCILDEALDALGDHADAIGELRERRTLDLEEVARVEELEA